MESELGVIAHLAVVHERRVDDGDTWWDEYTVTVDDRTFRLNLGASEPQQWEATISEVLVRRHRGVREPYRTGMTAATWHDAYAAALATIVTGVVTGDWDHASNVTPPIPLMETAAWRRRRTQAPDAE